MNASSGRADSRAYRTTGFVLIFLIFAAVCYVFIRALVFGSVIDERALQQSLIAAGVGVTIACLIVWLLDVLRVISMRPGWSKLLWGVLIASLLANSALAYKRWTNRSAALSVACFLPLQTDSTGNLVKPYRIRENATYRRGDPIAYLAAIRGMEPGSDGDYGVELHAALEDSQRGLARFARGNWSASKEKLQNSADWQQRLKWFKAAAPECITDQTLTFKSILRGATGTSMPLGLHDLRVTVFDVRSGAFVTATADVKLVASSP